MRSVRTSLTLGAVVLASAMVGPAGTASAAPGASEGTFALDNNATAARRWSVSASAAAPSVLTTIGITRPDTRAKSEINGGYSFKGDLMPESKSVTEGPSDTVDDVPLRMPDTTGNVDNFAGFNGQTLELSTGQQRKYTKLHFFGTTADGAGGGDFTLIYTQGADAKVTVNFADWCQGPTQDSHYAIGPIPGRYTLTGDDGAPCSIFHLPVANPDPGRTLKAIKFPPSTNAGGNIRAYLMALTLEEEGSGFRMPYLDGVDPYPTDTGAPVATGTLTGQADANGWHRTPPTLTIGAEDEADGSGVERIQYRINGGPGRSYTGPVAITDEGELNIEYRAYDRAGNPSTFKSIKAKVDATAPATNAITFPTELPTGFSDSEVKVTLGAQDGSGSGTARTEYRVNASESTPWTPYTGVFDVGGTGTQVVEFRSADKAGNVEEPKTLTVRVDTQAPTTTVAAQRRGSRDRLHRWRADRVHAHRRRGQLGRGAHAVPPRRRRLGRLPRRVRRDGPPDAPARLPLDRRRRQRRELQDRALHRSARPRRCRRRSSRRRRRRRRGRSPRSEEVATRVRTVSALRGGRFTVNVSCQGVTRGTLSATVTSSVRRKLQLRSGTLASKKLDCGAQGRATVSLKPSSAVRKALARTKTSVRVKLTLRMAGAPADTQTVTLKGKS